MNKFAIVQALPLLGKTTVAAISDHFTDGDELLKNALGPDGHQAPKSDLDSYKQFDAYRDFLQHHLITGEPGMLFTNMYLYDKLLEARKFPYFVLYPTKADYLARYRSLITTDRPDAASIPESTIGEWVDHLGYFVRKYKDPNFHVISLSRGESVADVLPVILNKLK
jgi:hypothetical protein